MKDEQSIKQLREFLKEDVRKRTDFTQSDQSLGHPMPPVEKPLEAGQEALALPEWRDALTFKEDIAQLIARRQSVRRYADEALSAEEVSFLLWATQGVRRVQGERVLRHVPSAGNRHALETYLALTRPLVARDGRSFAPGLWRYLPLGHALVFLKSPEALPDQVAQAAMGQAFVGQAPVTFIWSAIPYRMEWRYRHASVKEIALDAGHVCQNLYLAAEAIRCATCAVAAYDQPAADALLGLDGEDEFVIYMAPVGKSREN
ncbi:MAG: SagB/ThcOx family dehydrogenase [Clostridiales bacterium]|nr:SagB/ThcOx family dehydrogenase [Clostridiales bacterium]